MSRKITARIAAACAALLTTVSLTACAGGSTTASNGSKDDGDANTITFWSNHPGSSRDLEQELIDEFEKENPDLKVELVTAGSNYEEVAQRFNAALAGGDLPDVLVASDVTWFNFALNEATTPLDELWEMNDIDSESYVDTLREDYKYKDKHYGVPYSRSTNLMYWNTDDLKAAGLPTDRGPKDWEEFDEWATKIKDKLDKPAVTVPDGSNYLDWYFQGMIWAFGGSYSDEWEPNFTAKESIEAGKFLQDHEASWV